MMGAKVVTMKDKKVVLVANVKDAPFKCVVCRKVFISEGHLGRHYTRRHPSLNLPLHSWTTKVKAENVDCESDQHSIKAVLNATERIECLLANLTLGAENVTGLPQNEIKNRGLFQKNQFHVKTTFSPMSTNNADAISPEPANRLSNDSNAPTENDSNATFDLPLANSTQREFNSDSLEDIASYLENRSFSEDEDSSGEVAHASGRSIPLLESNIQQNNEGAPDGFKKYISIENQSTCSSISNEKTLKEDALLNKTFSCLESEPQAFGRSIPLLESNVQQNTEGAPDGFKKSIPIENRSTCSSISNEKTLKEDALLNKTFSCLESEENEALQRIISYAPKPLPRRAGVNYTSSACPSLTLNETFMKENSSDAGSHGKHETLLETKKRFKENALLIFNGKLRKYGIDPDWDKVPDKTAQNVEGLLKAERDKIKKNYPDYNNLRELINHNVNTRIEMSLRR